MTNLEKYNRVFMEVFSVSEKAFDQEFSNQTIKGWDSIKQLSLITSLEDELCLIRRILLLFLLIVSVRLY